MGVALGMSFDMTIQSTMLLNDYHFFFFLSVLDVADAIYLSDTISATFSRDAKKRAFPDSLKLQTHTVSACYFLQLNSFLTPYPTAAVPISMGTTCPTVE